MRIQTVKKITRIFLYCIFHNYCFLSVKPYFAAYSRLTLSALSPGLRNFYLVLNAAWIESNVTFRAGEVVSEPDRPMQGQSPYIVNAGLHYSSEKAGLDMALLYNRAGKRIVGLGKQNSIDPDPNTLIPDSYEMPRNALDFTVSKKLGERIELRAAVKDMLSEDVVYKQFPRFVKDGVTHRREQITRQYNPGQSVSVGVSMKF